jgi:hypothetical protein
MKLPAIPLFGFVLVVSLICAGLMALGGYGGGYGKNSCPPTQPGLIVRDLEHPPAERTPDQEWVVICHLLIYEHAHVLQVGLNKAQAEGLAYQLNDALKNSSCQARKAVTVESTKPNGSHNPPEAKP